MKRTSGRENPGIRSTVFPSSSLRRELAEQYSELPVQSVTIALDQATRAAAALLTGTDTAGGDAALVAMLARDRLNAQRARRAAADRRVHGHHRSRYADTHVSMPCGPGAGP